MFDNNSIKTLDKSIKNMSQLTSYLNKKNYDATTHENAVNYVTETLQKKENELYKLEDKIFLLKKDIDVLYDKSDLLDYLKKLNEKINE